MSGEGGVRSYALVRHLLPLALSSRALHPLPNPKSYDQVPAQCRSPKGLDCPTGTRVLLVLRHGSDMRQQSILHMHDLITS